MRRSRQGAAVVEVGLVLGVLLVAAGAAEAAGGQTAKRGGHDADALHPELEGCSIAILDVNDLAEEHGIPRCSLANIVVDARTQVPYLREFSTSKAGREKRVIPTPHYFSGNSAPWFARRAVERSGLLTQDAAAADVVLVDDYCHKLWWLSYIHSDKKDQLPGEHLFHIYERMLERPEWRDGPLGQRHVFFQSHTGFAHGPLGDAYERFLCETLVNSMHVVNVRASRLRCKRAPYQPGNFVIAPGSVHYHEIHAFQEAEAARLEAGGADHDRDFLLFFKGKCTPANFTWKAEAVANGIAQSTVNVGKTMRVHIVQAIQGMGREVRVACTGDARELADVQNERPHWEQMDEFTRSTFCMLAPGDSQTSRRLPEAIMAGCIPVFPGPPFHTMPFADQIDYSQFSLFYKFKKTPWADSITIHWEIDASDNTKRPHHPTDSEWWVPDFARTQEVAVEVDDPQAMVAHLRALPAAEVARLQRAVQAVQPQFAYQERPGGGETETAADVLVRAMCRRARALDAGELGTVPPREMPAEWSTKAGRPQQAAAAAIEEDDGNGKGATHASASDAGPAKRGKRARAVPAESSTDTDRTQQAAAAALEEDDGGVRTTHAHASDAGPARVGNRARARRRRRKETRAHVTREQLTEPGAAAA